MKNNNKKLLIFMPFVLLILSQFIVLHLSFSNYLIILSLITITFIAGNKIN